MARKYNREEVVARLRIEIAAERPIFAVGAGNGLVARCADQGGADLIVTYNSGHFRLNGLPSFVGLLPVGDANETMLRLGRESIMPWRRSVPVIGGVYAIDPTRPLEYVLDEMDKLGFSGVINFPSIGRFDGNFRQELEAAGFGFEREVDLVRKAREREVFSMAYVYNAAEAQKMTEAGVDVIVGHLGLTTGGDIGASCAKSLDEGVNQLRTIFDAVQKVRADIICLSHGGAISSPEDAAYVNANTAAVGFVAASSFERIPIERALKQTCTEFKAPMPVRS